MSQHSTDALAVYSDYVCPFCYLGKAAMEEYREETDDAPEVEWRFYDLRGYKRNPDGSIDHDVDDGKDDDYFAQARENINRLKERYDVEMNLDLSKNVDSWNAQQAALYVRQTEGKELFLDFHESVFDALWQDGRDIGDTDVLADLAESVGLDGREIRDATTDETLEAELRERFEQAQQAGVSGIPTFVYAGHAARGAIPPEQFERLVEGGE
ncbi:DsbA family oxidoreductase [Halorussus pelagicus]|uniref:DsbA family oxidoreductase n=1 Tax=Halorussus pelagicus TaxID=2505977 RepID=UPI000FFBAB6B|nr:DsbA family oxidoreductase [Halorussus pelagicus]